MALDVLCESQFTDGRIGQMGIAGEWWMGQEGQLCSAGCRADD